MRWLLPALLTLALAACSTAPKKSSPSAIGGGNAGASGIVHAPGAKPGKDCSFYAPAQEDPSKRGNYTAGGLYAPGVADTTPDHLPDLDCISEPIVTALPRSPIGNRSPYSVLGKQYRVLDDTRDYVETGTASYYGNKFHGRRTSNQEVYDMYAFTAAHKTLPLPSFARVTNLDNGKSVVVRVNDRGPFHDGRVIDLSYAAAVKLGITQRGTGRVEVRALAPGDAVDASRVATAVAPAPAPARSGMDGLVERLPASPSTAVAASTPASQATGDTARRYYAVATPGQPASADRFDQWMQANGVSIATGKPATVQRAADGKRDAKDDERLTFTRIGDAPAAAASPVNGEARAASAVAPSRPLGQALQLQVGSFASRENADRALARLVAAGIADARLSDVTRDGRVMWRLRVDASDAARADELAGRIAGLGFGRPQIVRE